MKKTHTRILALLLSMVMVFSLLTACGGTPSTPSNPDSQDNTPSDPADPASDPLLNNEETINLTVFSQTANWSGAQTGWAATLLKDKFNIELTIIPDTNGAYQTRMESKNLGDIVVWGTNGDDYTAAVNQGLLFNWDEEDLVSTYGPYISEHFADGLAANKALNADGKLYGIGNDITDTKGQHDSFIYDWGIRWDLYEQLGRPEVNNLDDLADVLEQMKGICPTGDDGKPAYAVSIWPDWDGDNVMYVKSMASAYFGTDGDKFGMGQYDAANGKLYPNLESGSPYLQSLKFFNDLYRRGLVDPDSMTQTYDQMMPKMQNGNCFFSIFSWAGTNLYNSPKHLTEAENPSFMATLVPKEATPIVYGLSTGGNARIWSIGNNTMYPEKCMQLINWLYTPEGAMTIWYGIKGLMWDYDANGNIVLTELGEQCRTDKQTDLTGVEWTSPDTGKTYTLDGNFNDGMIQINNTSWALGAVNPEASGECYHPDTWASLAGEPRNDVEAAWREYSGAINAQEYLNANSYKVNPTVPDYNTPERDPELQVKWDQCATAIKQYSWQAIYAKDDAEFDSIVAKMQSECDAYGYADCVKWCEEQAQVLYSMQ